VAGNQRRYGGYLAHMGVIMTAAAITASSSGKIEREATLKPGQTMQVDGNLTVRLKTLWGKEEPRRQVIGADVEVLKNGTVIGIVDPRMNFYRTQEQPVPTPAVRSRPQGDIYMNLMAFTPDGSSATIKVILEPFVPWIWFGGLIVALGAVVSAWPTARTSRREARATAPRAVRASSGPVPEFS
jgi:cytochrome c-type biogenesis protein CcmF